MPIQRQQDSGSFPFQHPMAAPIDSTATDPKGTAGLLKPQLQAIPPIANRHMAAALALGAAKYGPWNWRGRKVEAMTYLGAMRRHIDAYLDGENLDPESGASHLGHVMAGCAIVLDAEAHGNLIDNRPPRHPIPAPPRKPNTFRRFLIRLRQVF
jgi:hypothetical protein